MTGFIFDPKNLYITLVTKEVVLIQIQLKVMIKTSKKSRCEFSVSDKPNTPQSSCTNSTIATHKYVIVQ